MAFMVVIMLAVTFILWSHQDEKLISGRDLDGSVIYTIWFAVTAFGFCLAAFCWKKGWWYAGLPLMLLGAFGLFGSAAFFAADADTEATGGLPISMYQANEPVAHLVNTSPEILPETLPGILPEILISTSTSSSQLNTDIAIKL